MRRLLCCGDETHHGVAFVGQLPFRTNSTAGRNPENCCGRARQSVRGLFIVEVGVELRSGSTFATPDAVGIQVAAGRIRAASGGSGKVYAGSADPIFAERSDSAAYA